MFDTLIVFLVVFVEKFNCTKSQPTTKIKENFPACKELKTCLVKKSKESVIRDNTGLDKKKMSVIL